MIRYEGPNLKLSERAMYREFESPEGMVGDHLRRISQVVITGANGLIGVRTGRMKRSLYRHVRRDARGLYAEIGANHEKAFDHHEGTPPHVIEAQTGRVLRFRQGGRVVYARRINHPGTRGRKFLTVPLARAVR